MDALTNFELEAQRRRETIETDRRAADRVLFETPVDAGPLARVVVRPPRRWIKIQADCEPATLARQSAG
jgi:hypothetical protein